MSLSPSSLESKLRQVFESPESFTSRQQAEARWARIYDEYASNAEDISTDRVATKNSIGFRRALNFQNNLTTARFARQIEQGFLSYWTGATFAVGIPPAGTGVPCPNVGGNSIFGIEASSVVITTTPNVMFSNLFPVLRSFTRTTSAQQKAREIAQAMHTATTTAIFVLISGTDTTPGPGGPLPITNTCTIF